MSDVVAESADSQATGRSIRSTLFRWFRFICQLVAALIWFVVGLGLLLRMTVRDQYQPLALIYYLTPIPSLPIWILLSGFAQRLSLSPKALQTRRRLTRFCAMSFLVFIIWAYCSECVNRPQTAGPNDIRLAFWNTAHVTKGISNLAQRLRDHDADVIGLVESGRNSDVVMAAWQRGFPGYELAKTSFEGLVAVRGKIISRRLHLLKPSSWCEQFELRVGDVEFTLLLVDICSQLTLSRSGPLQDLAELAERLSDRPLIIMGDFNTPDDSVLLNPLRKHCRLLFRECGYGYAATWPLPCPVLTLDQVWVNDFVLPSRCEHVWTILSDHRPVFSSVAFRQSQP